MRVTCDGCGAKYAIADERLQGRSVRVKCKKCGASIAVGALNAAGGAAPAEPTWTVLLDDGEQKPVTPEQLAELYREGTVHDDSYLWKDGMGDWLPLSELEEAKRIVSGAPEPGVEVTAVPVADPAALAPAERARRAVTSSPNVDLFGEGGATPKTPGAAAPQAASPALRSEATPLSPRAAGGEATPLSAGSAPVSQRPGVEAAPFSSRAGAAPFSSRAGAASASPRSAGEGLFGPSSSPGSRRAAAEPALSPRAGAPAPGRSAYDDRVNASLSGSRNDDSVLFSVAALSATPKKSAPAAPAEAKAPEAAAAPAAPGVITSDAEASGMIDMRILSTMHSKGPKKEEKREDRVDDLMNMGLSGPLFGGPSLTSPLLAPPPLEAPPAPPEPPAPEPPPAPAAAAEPAPSSGGTARDAEAPPIAAAATQPSAPRSKLPRWAPFAAGGVGLLLLGAIGVSALGGPSDAEKEAATATAAKAKADTAAAREAPPPAAEPAPAPEPAADAPKAAEVAPAAPEAAPAEAPKADEGAAPAAAAARPEAAAAAPRPAEARKRDEESGKKRREREEAERKEAEQRRAEQEKKAAEGKAAAAAAAAAAAPGGTAPFDRGAASAALSSASGGVSACKKADGPSGLGRVAVTFAPSGVVSSAVVEGPPFAGTPVGACVAGKFRAAKVPAFAGPPITVKKSFSL
ncbi:MAG TPA: zinc-ribbon domain-containing protein [Polyangiaceae bacterium]|nr:zinc-ribbon domain-containing protein [Polyangiaceae bacterium]